MSAILHPADPARAARSQLTDFARFAAARTGIGLETYADLHAFSVGRFREFWALLLEWSRLRWEGTAEPACHGDAVETARFFPELRLSWPENLLAVREPAEELAPAVIARDETGARLELTRAQLRMRVRAAAAALAARGVRPRRPRGRGGPEHGRTPHRLPGRDLARRQLVVGGARHGARRSAEPLHAARAEGPVRSPPDVAERCPPRPRPPGTARGAPIAGIARRAGRDRCRPRPGDPADRPRGAGGRGPGPARDRCQRGVPALPLRSSALRSLLLGNHRRAQVHRPRPWGNTAGARQGTPAALRPGAGGPAALPDLDRLDDVELDVQRARNRSVPRALRWLGDLPGARFAPHRPGRGEGHGLRNQPGLRPVPRRRGCDPRPGLPARPARDALDGVGALPPHPPVGQGAPRRRPAPVHLRRNRHRRMLRDGPALG